MSKKKEINEEQKEKQKEYNRIREDVDKNLSIQKTEKTRESVEDNKKTDKPKKEAEQDKKDTEMISEDDEIQDKTSEENVDYYFSSKEVDELKDKYFQVVNELNLTIIEKKEITKKYRGRINEKEAEIFELLKKIDTRKEVRKMDCIVLFNYRLGKKKCVHPQTGEIIWERNMTDEDKQQRLPMK